MDFMCSRKRYAGLLAVAIWILGCGDAARPHRTRVDAGADQAQDAGTIGLLTFETWLSNDGLTAGTLEHAIEGVRPTSASLRPIDVPLLWEHRDADGDLVDQGIVADPRVGLSDFNAEGQPDPVVARASIATLRVNLSAPGGTLHVFLALPTAGDEQDDTSWSPGPEQGATPVPNAVSPTTPGSGEGLENNSSTLDCVRRLNVLLLPEGFTEPERPAFEAAAAKVVEQVQGKLPGVNVWTQWIASKESGISDPPMKKDTAFDSSFGDGSAARPRRVVMPGEVKPYAAEARREAEAAVGAHTVLIMLNTTEHAGAATPDTATFSMSPSFLQTAVHELGHALYRLADEYTYGTCKLGAAGQAANVTTTPESPPWMDLVNTTQLPTLTGGPTTVGAFEGAEYCPHGVYRPQLTCLMRELNSDFCEVCQRVVNDKTQCKRSCFAGPPCKGSKVCSWNGIEDGYCCRDPFTASLRCMKDSECATGEVCAFNGEAYFCVKPTSECEQP